MFTILQNNINGNILILGEKYLKNNKPKKAILILNKMAFSFEFNFYYLEIRNCSTFLEKPLSLTTT